MAVAPGHYRLGPDNGRIVLRTFRQGLGARAGHDLVIDVPRWSGELTVNDDKTLASIEATIDMTSWIVRQGNGGIKPLTDRDRREITTTARRVLSTQRPTVFTDTPSWRAAASWVRPSRRRVDDIQSAKVAGRADAGDGAGAGAVRDGAAAGAAAPTA